MSGTNQIYNFRSTGNRGEQLDRPPLLHIPGKERDQGYSLFQPYKQPQNGQGDSASKAQAHNYPFNITFSRPQQPQSSQPQPLTLQKPKNAKRRLFVEDMTPKGKEISVKPKTIIPLVQEKVSDTEKSPPRDLPLKITGQPLKTKITAPANFFEGQGASAWLNFTLDIKDVLRSLDL